MKLGPMDFRVGGDWGNFKGHFLKVSLMTVGQIENLREV